MIEVKDLSLTIGGKPILKKLSFHIGKGEFVCLIGPNGAGKTTLLRVLSGHLRDYDGVASVNSLHIKALSQRGLSQKVAVLPQEEQGVFDFTALEIVLMGRYPYQQNRFFDSAWDLSIARQAMLLMDCEQFADRPIDTLSGGERQRVFLARALTQKTDILLLDEPASHLDIAHQQRIYSLLSDLNRRIGLTIICVVHDFTLTQNLFDRFIFLKNGEITSVVTGRDSLSASDLKGVFDVPFTEKTVLVPE